jgi:microsomal dipeptidase-like Zn-dependent dipeptidase
VVASLERYHGLGVRVLFPVHKFDNGFSAGDGHRGFIEIGNVANSGYYGNFTDIDCPGMPDGFDHGPVQFGGLNRPRAVFDAEPPLNMSRLPTSPLTAFAPVLSNLREPKLEGEYCQNAGLQPLGEFLMREMMKRGMIVEIDHLPQRSRKRAFELLREAEYPAAGTHKGDNRGELYALGGISTTDLPRCQSADQPDVAAGYRARIQRIRDQGGYPAQGLGLDNNGFARQPGPRFGEDGCGGEQANPVTYPFASFAGDVTFTAPRLGNRVADFNTEGMLHIGLLPELIEDARRMGMSDADLEPFFRSAEGYVRMWELAESRGAVLSQD